MSRQHGTVLLIATGRMTMIFGGNSAHRIGVTDSRDAHGTRGTGGASRPSHRFATVAGGVVLCVTTAFVTVGGATPVTAAPGTPGVPQPGIVLLNEDFSNATAPVSILSYTGGAASGNSTYTADPAWTAAGVACNGWIANSTAPMPSDSSCSRNGAWANIQQMALALGLAQGMSPADAARNNILSEYTNSPAAQQAAGQTLLLLSSGSATATAGHFYAVSGYFAAQNCAAGNNPAMRFSLLVNGTPTVLGSGINPCSSSNNVPGFSPWTSTTGGSAVWVSALRSDAMLMPTAAQLGFKLENTVTAGTGNDLAFDLPQVVDVTPQLDMDFADPVIPVAASTTLVFTITNTDDLLAKPGWSFTTNLPSGLEATGTAPGTCTSPVVNLSGGVITASGNLGRGETKCTIAVSVRAPAPGSYTVPARNVTTTGLLAPADATLVTSRLDLTATVSPATVSAPGKTVTYTYTVTNPGPAKLDALRLDNTGAYTDSSKPGFSGTGQLTTTCDKTSLNSGESATCTASYVVTATDIAAVTIRNVAQASAVAGGATARTISATAATAVTYVPSIQTTNVVFVDDGLSQAPVAPRTGFVARLTGPSGTAVGFTEAMARSGIPAGYLFVSLSNVTTYDFDDAVDQVITVHLSHDIGSTTITSNRHIVYTGAGSMTPPSVDQTIDWTVTTDHATGEITYSTTATGYPALTSPALNGYTPDAASVAALAVPATTGVEPQSTTVTVTYAPNAQTVRVVFVDDESGATVTPVAGFTATLTGPGGTAVGFDQAQAAPGIPGAYVFVSLDNVATYDLDDAADQVITVHLAHQILGSTLVTSRLIRYTGAGDANPPDKIQVIAWGVTTDAVTGDTTYVAESNTRPAAISPVITGFTVDLAEVPAQAVTSPTTIKPQSETVIVTYTGTIVSTGGALVGQAPSLLWLSPLLVAAGVWFLPRRARARA